MFRKRFPKGRVYQAATGTATKVPICEARKLFKQSARVNGVAKPICEPRMLIKRSAKVNRPNRPNSGPAEGETMA